MAMFSRRHYKAISDCLKERKELLERRFETTEELRIVANDMSRMFQRDNYNFKPDMFLKAAGFSE